MFDTARYILQGDHGIGIINGHLRGYQRRSQLSTSKETFHTVKNKLKNYHRYPIWWVTKLRLIERQTYQNDVGWDTYIVNNWALFVQMLCLKHSNSFI